MAGTLLNIKPILTLADGEVLPLKKVRGSQKAYREFGRAFEEGTRGRARPTGRDRPRRGARAPRSAGASWCGTTRPQAQIEVATTLGPVVGTHAGPGTVGFFWFHDP